MARREVGMSYADQLSPADTATLRAMWRRLHGLTSLHVWNDADRFPIAARFYKPGDTTKEDHVLSRNGPFATATIRCGPHKWEFQVMARREQMVRALPAEPVDWKSVVDPRAVFVPKVETVDMWRYVVPLP